MKLVTSIPIKSFFCPSFNPVSRSYSARTLEAIQDTHLGEINHARKFSILFQLFNINVCCKSKREDRVVTEPTEVM